MNMKYNGTQEDLVHTITGCGFNVTEQRDNDSHIQVRTSEGAIVNWYHSTGTLVFQGKKAIKDKLIASWGDYHGETANVNQARFGIVLLTPDDIAHSKADGPDSAQPRARQNVILEMGMLISAVGRGNVAILKKGHLEAPSDAQGILYIPFNDHVKETVPKLADRLRQSGFVLNPESISRASS
jgi:predicted nucleotide-binding protein